MNTKQNIFFNIALVIFIITFSKFILKIFNLSLLIGIGGGIVSSIILIVVSKKAIRAQKDKNFIKLFFLGIFLRFLVLSTLIIVYFLFPQKIIPEVVLISYIAYFILSFPTDFMFISKK